MDSKKDLSQIEWYISHRLEHIEISTNLKTDEILSSDMTTADPELLREVLENRGRIKELRHLLDWLERWNAPQ